MDSSDCGKSFPSRQLIIEVGHMTVVAVDQVKAILRIKLWQFSRAGKLEPCVVKESVLRFGKVMNCHVTTQNVFDCLRRVSGTYYLTLRSDYVELNVAW